MYVSVLVAIFLAGSPDAGILPSDASARCGIVEAILSAGGETGSGPKARRLPPFVETNGKLVSGDGKLWLRVVDPSGADWLDLECGPRFRFVSVPVRSYYGPTAPHQLLQIELTLTPDRSRILFIQRTAVFNVPPGVGGVAALPWCYRGEVWKTESAWTGRLQSVKACDEFLRRTAPHSQEGPRRRRTSR